MEPKVSIIIPVYNGSNYLRQAIDSALGQTYLNIEVIVVNDGSSDGGETDEIARSYGERIRYFYKENGGVASALNLSIEKMEGVYFSWLSHDDVYYPEKIEKQISFSLNIDKNVILYSDYNYIDEKSRYLRTMAIHDIPSSQFKAELLCQSELINGCSLLIPRNCFAQTGLFDVRLHTIQDYDMWFRMSEQFDFVHIPAVLVGTRIHRGQGTWARRELWQKEGEKFYTFNIMKIISDWNDDAVDFSLGVFSVRACIKMERFGLDQSVKLCQKLIGKNWRKEIRNLNFAFVYWMTYYLLYLLKRKIVNTYGTLVGTLK
jgi:hypothetical protein